MRMMQGDVHARRGSRQSGRGRAADPEIRGVLEPVLEDYAFITPSDSGSDDFAASLKYSVKLYSPDGPAGGQLDVYRLRHAAGQRVSGQGR
jgi:hypothetical protein